MQSVLFLHLVTYRLFKYFLLLKKWEYHKCISGVCCLCMFKIANFLLRSNFLILIPEYGVSKDKKPSRKPLYVYLIVVLPVLKHWKILFLVGLEVSQ